MTNLETIVQQLTYVAKTPDKQFREALLSGRKVIGCFPVYTPEPLAYAAGFLPMGLWGGGVTPFQAKRYVPAFCCPVMQADLEYGIQGTYEGMSAVMIPTLCDTFRCITQNWKVSVPGVEMLAVTYPQTRDAAGEEFLCSELVQIRGALERLSGKKITEEALADAIEIYNEHSVAMMRFAEVANEHLDVIRPQVRHAVMKSAWFMDKKAHIHGLAACIVRPAEQQPRLMKSGLFCVAALRTRGCTPCDTCASILAHPPKDTPALRLFLSNGFDNYRPSLSLTHDRFAFPGKAVFFIFT